MSIQSQPPSFPQPVSPSGEPGGGIAVLGEFEIRREIGRGGMGTVYAAFQRSLQREVALKVLGQQVGASPQAVERFRREAQAAAKLHHPHIIPIFALGEEHGVYYYAMELVQGPGLNAVIADIRTKSGVSVQSEDPAATVPIVRKSDVIGGRQALSSSGVARASPNDTTVVINPPRAAAAPDPFFREVAEQIADLADALDYAHRAGVIHRDIKPHNLLFGADGKLRISDFGLARLTEQPGVTVTGELVGSPLYMSPEQIRGDVGGIDHRTDIYSLGATLYEWLCFRPPYPGDTREQVISRILTTEPPALRSYRPQIPHDLETICLKAIERDVARRYQSAAELRDDLRRFLEQRPVRARRDGVFFRARKSISRNRFGVFAVAAGVVAALLVWQLFSVRKEVKVQTAAAVQAQEENERLRSTLEYYPLEIAGPLKLAEVARPVLSDVLGSASAALAPSGGRASSGPDPDRVGTASGIAHRAVQDFYVTVAPPAWRLGDVAGTGELPTGIAQALSFWHSDPERALVLVDSCLASNPADVDARQLKAALLARLGKYDNMQSEAEEFVRQQPRDANAFIWRGLAYLLRGDAQRSLADFGQAVQLSRFSPWSMTFHAVALLHSQKTLEALSVLDGVLADEPELVVALLCRAAVRTSQGNYFGAIADVSDVLEIEPRNPDALALRGNLFVEVNDFAAAERDYELSMKIAGPNASIRARWMITRIQQGLQSPPPAPESPGTEPIPPDPTSGTTQTGRGPDQPLAPPESRFAKDNRPQDRFFARPLTTGWTFGVHRPR